MPPSTLMTCALSPPARYLCMLFYTLMTCALSIYIDDVRIVPTGQVPVYVYYCRDCRDLRKSCLRAGGGCTPSLFVYLFPFLFYFYFFVDDVRIISTGKVSVHSFFIFYILFPSFFICVILFFLMTCVSFPSATPFFFPSIFRWCAHHPHRQGTAPRFRVWGLGCGV